MNHETLLNTLTKYFDDEVGYGSCNVASDSESINKRVSVIFSGSSYRDFIRAALSSSHIVEHHGGTSCILGHTNDGWFLNVFEYDVSSYNDICEASRGLEWEDDYPRMFYAKLRPNIYRRGIKVRPSVLNKYQGIVSGEGSEIFAPENDFYRYRVGDSSFVEPFEKILPEWGFSEINLRVRVIDEDDSMRIQLAI